MTDAQKAVALRALRNLRGDDLERARRAFSALSDAEMDKQHGQSGKTRRDILTAYENDRRVVDDTIRAVEAL